MMDLGLLDRIAAAVTEGDALNIALLQDYGVRYIEHTNQPIGAKFNAALHLAGEAPAYMVLPSDDLISEEWRAVYLGATADYIAPDSCALFDTVTGRAKVLRWRGRGTLNFGAGRIFSRRVVEALGGKVWSDGRTSGLDSDSHGRMYAAGFAHVVHRCEKIPITDLKSEGNIWRYETWKGEDITPAEALHMAPWVLTSS